MIISFNFMGVVSAEFSKPACDRLNRQKRLRQKNQEPAALAEEKSELDERILHKYLVKYFSTFSFNVRKLAIVQNVHKC